MSFILDALKRADRERGQGAAASPTGLSGTGPVAMPPLASASPAPWWPWAAAALALLAMMAAAGWWWSSHGTAAGQREVAQAPSAAAPPASVPLPASRPVLSAFLPPAVAPSAKASPSTAAPKQPAFLPETSARATPAGPAPASPEPSAPVPLQALPPEIRQRVPTLRLSGSILSPRRADRLLIVDGQVAHEGDVVAPGVVLEQILPRSAVFRFQQHRFEVPY